MICASLNVRQRRMVFTSCQYKTLLVGDHFNVKVASSMVTCPRQLNA